MEEEEFITLADLQNAPYEQPIREGDATDYLLVFAVLLLFAVSTLYFIKKLKKR